jgi:HSP20 family protein
MSLFKKNQNNNKDPIKNLITKEGELAVDVFQTEKEFWVIAPLAGVELENLKVLAENDILTIQGERKNIFEDDGEKKVYILKEVFWGPFVKRIVLPKDLEISKIKAQIQKGFLVIKIPKKNSEKKEVINVEIKT